MQITSISPLLPSFYSPNQKHSKTTTTTTTTRLLCRCSSNKHPQTQYKTTTSTNTLQQDQNIIYANKDLLIDEMYSFLTNNQDQVERENELTDNKVHRGISSNMWWHNLKATLGQRFNMEGISSAVAVMTRDCHLALPHIAVKDISWIDWTELKKKGFVGVVFDKDNTLTVPYSLSVWGPLESSLDCCKSVFGDNVAVFSNSAGLYQYDADGSKARVLEESVGIHVVKHGVKKPGGSAEAIEKFFGCSTSLLIMVGDRHFTDMVYGNRNGFLTILTEPLSLDEEPFVVKQVRKLETSLANYWHRRGLKPISHSGLSEALQCVKVLPPL